MTLSKQLVHWANPMSAKKIAVIGFVEVGKISLQMTVLLGFERHG